ncbi:hypothetical protein [Streptomyces sp. NBC_01538]|uniref:hypothetical protein n=1 Tax=Streptomyces sp. NBC_01538 TaxID=2903897 RepID=UPI00386C65F7
MHRKFAATAAAALLAAGAAAACSGGGAPQQSRTPVQTTSSTTQAPTSPDLETPEQQTSQPETQTPSTADSGVEVYSSKTSEPGAWTLGPFAHDAQWRVDYQYDCTGVSFPQFDLRAMEDYTQSASTTIFGDAVTDTAAGGSWHGSEAADVQYLHVDTNCQWKVSAYNE